jgi:hypothetical protein
LFCDVDNFCKVFIPQWEKKLLEDGTKKRQRAGRSLIKGVKLITTVRKNMKAKAISLWDRAMLSKRFIIETINDQLKNISFIEHSRHRSMNGFMLNLVAGLVAYCLKENKPHLNLTDVELNALVIA